MAYKKLHQYEMPNNTRSHFQSEFLGQRVKKFLRRTVRGDTNYSLPSNSLQIHRNALAAPWNQFQCNVDSSALEGQKSLRHKWNVNVTRDIHWNYVIIIIYSFISQLKFYQIFKKSINYIVEPLPLFRFVIVYDIIKTSIVTPTKIKWLDLEVWIKIHEFYLLSRQLTTGYSFRKHCGRNKLK